MGTEKYRTGLRRLLGAIVDGIVFLPLMLVEQWIYKATSNISILFAWSTFIAFAPLLYSITLHYKTGQTIGKWITAVQVLDISATRKLTLRQSILRDTFYLAGAVVGVVYFGFQLSRSSGTTGNVLADYSSFSDNAVLWWTLLELITMFTNAKRRAVHDFLAKSVVVRTETSR